MKQLTESMVANSGQFEVVDRIETVQGEDGHAAI